MRMIAGAILIHAACVLGAAGGIADDGAFLPGLFGLFLILSGLIREWSTPAAPTKTPKDE